MCNKACNFPAGTSHTKAIEQVTHNAGAAFLHFRATNVCKFAWSVDVLGPRATLVYILDGPRLFARVWIKLFVHEVVARSRLFAMLPSAIVEHIARWP